jgi:hypothetical protein
MLNPLMRRALPAIVLLAFLLVAAPSALAMRHSRTERISATSQGQNYNLHQKADSMSGRKADSRSGVKADAKSSRKTHSKSHRSSGGKSSAARSRVPFSTNLTPAAFLLGDNAVQSRENTLSAEHPEAFRFRAQAAGVTGAAQIYLGASNAADVVTVGLYSNANDHPGTLLSAGSIVAPTAGAWNSVPLTSSQIVPGTSYWIAILGEGGRLSYSDSQWSSCPSEMSAQGNLSALPTTWSTGRARRDCPLAAYVTAATVLPPPVETPQVEEPPTETPPVEKPPTETPPTEKAPVEEAPTEKMPVETPPVETPPVETPPIETSPPPAAPTNIAMPAIGGTPTAGQTLRATSGTWTGSPTYSYQWRRCSSSGHSCANVGGATGAGYTLSASDVSHTLRVMVTATNEGGSTSMSSPATSTVTAPAPAAPIDTALPRITGTTTEGHTLSATTGSWEGSPTGYTYQWQDCNTSGTNCTDIAGATTSSHKLTATDVEQTIRVVVTATNEGGSTPATSTATVAVAATPPPPPPTAPTNTAAPTATGTATEGQTLSATTGSWESNPTGYTYQWQDCNTSGTNCTNIAGATASTHVLTTSDVGDTLRVLVKASNAGGTGESTSGATAVVVAKQSGGTSESCFSSPESCGYPGPQNTGVANCSALKASGGKTITKAETVEGLDITGEVVVAASGVKFNNDCIEVNGNEEEGSAAVVLNNGASNFTISNSTIRGKNTTSQSIEEALRNNYSNAGATAINDRLENCAECLHQTWTINESYVIANGEEKADESGQSHAEDWWFDNGTISANDDTLLNPSKQTAVVFAESGGGSCENHETVTNSLLAGGGFVFYFCAHSSGAGSSSIDIKNNHFARDICTKKEISNYEGRGGYGCGPEGSYFSYGEGSGGYFPRGGFFGVVYEGEGVYNKGAGWEGNYWDNNLASVQAP